MQGRIFLAIVIAILGTQSTQAADNLELDGFDRLEGFVDLYWDADSGRILLEVDAFDQPFIYQSSLPRGIGSNDIGLDRGQLGNTKVVRFVRSGQEKCRHRQGHQEGRHQPNDSPRLF